MSQIELPGRHHLVAIASERWTASDRNRWTPHVRYACPGGIIGIRTAGVGRLRVHDRERALPSTGNLGLVGNHRNLIGDLTAGRAGRSAARDRCTRTSLPTAADTDSHVRDGIRSVLEEDGRTVEDCAACEVFLEAYRPGREACLVTDGTYPEWRARVAAAAA